MGDNRLAQRFPFRQEVECEGDVTGRFSTRISDLSTGGAFIDAITVFPVGSILNLKFWLKSSLIRVNAEVRYSMPSIGMGVKFLDLKPEDYAEISQAGSSIN